MLLLLKPWCNIQTDLKLPSQTWSEAFKTFLASTSKKCKDIVAGIQYFYEACTSTEDKRERNKENGTFVATQCTDFNHDDEEYELGEDAQVPDTTFNKEGLEALQAASVPWCKELHGRHAIE